MKICSHHDRELRVAFKTRGYEVPENGEEAQKFHAAGKRDLLNDARAHIIMVALREEPDLLLSPPSVCPICYLVKPSWIKSAVEGQLNQLKLQ